MIFLSQNLGSKFSFQNFAPHFWIGELHYMTVEILKLKKFTDDDWSTAINVNHTIDLWEYTCSGWPCCKRIPLLRRNTTSFIKSSVHSWTGYRFYDTTVCNIFECLRMVQTVYEAFRLDLKIVILTRYKFWSKKLGYNTMEVFWQRKIKEKCCAYTTNTFRCVCSMTTVLSWRYICEVGTACFWEGQFWKRWQAAWS